MREGNYFVPAESACARKKECGARVSCEQTDTRDGRVPHVVPKNPFVVARGKRKLSASYVRNDKTVYVIV